MELENVGRLTSLADQAGTGSYAYDPLGRIATETRVISGISKSIGYSYNLDGSLKSLTYPSGRIVNYAYDSAAHPLSAIDANMTQYISNATYWPNGAQYQTWRPNIYLRTDLNKRLQIAGFYSDNGQVGSFYLNKTYNYGAQNNGNIMSITNNKDPNRTENFTYDALNRLLSAQNAGADCSQVLPDGHTEYWGNNYGYDAWGNLTQKAVTKCSAENMSLTANPNNQLSGYGYDVAGNMTQDLTSGLAYSYDAENRLSGANGSSYTYDADGERVKKSNGSTGTLYWYGGPGIIAESDLSGTIKSEYVFFNGKRVARIDEPGNVVHYYLSDALNSTSMVVSAAGAIENESEYYPWGGELQFSNADPANHFKYGGHERDTETGLDDYGARFYSNGLGRFVTPDWSARATAVPYAEFADPQSLNLYTYVRNIPTVKIDANGHCPPCILTPFITPPGTIDTAIGLAKGGANFFIKLDNGVRDNLINLARITNILRSSKQATKPRRRQCPQARRLGPLPSLAVKARRQNRCPMTR